LIANVFLRVICCLLEEINTHYCWEKKALLAKSVVLGDCQHNAHIAASPKLKVSMVEDGDDENLKCSEDTNSASIEPLKKASSYTPSSDSDDNTKELHDGTK